MPPYLPEILVVLLGALSSIVIQFVKARFKTRQARFFISIGLTGLTGLAAYFIVQPPALDLPDTLAWIYAASGLAWGSWRSLWKTDTLRADQRY